MPALNRIQLIGYLGKDPETRCTPTGQKVCSFSLAYLEGRVRTERFEREGESRQITRVILGRMQMLDRRKDEEPLVSEEVDDFPEEEAG
jgi:single-stranded DNA-binding protein